MATIAYITLWFKARTSHASRHERSRAPDKRLAITLVMLSSHYCPQRPRSLRSTPRIATPDQVEFSVHTQSNRFVFFVGTWPLVTRMTSIIFPSTWLPFPILQSVINLCLIVFFFFPNVKLFKDLSMKILGLKLVCLIQLHAVL